MRLGRRASLLGALSLLAWAATASAECAWVLWQREAIEKRELAWAPRESFKTIGDCKQRESKADTRYNRETQKLEPIQAATQSASPTPWTRAGRRGWVDDRE